MSAPCGLRCCHRVRRRGWPDGDRHASQRAFREHDDRNVGQRRFHGQRTVRDRFRAAVRSGGANVLEARWRPDVLWFRREQCGWDRAEWQRARDVAQRDHSSAGGDYTGRGGWTRNESDAAPARQQLLGLAGHQPGGSAFHEASPRRRARRCPTTSSTRGRSGKTSPLALNMPFGIQSAYSIRDRVAPIHSRPCGLRVPSPSTRAARSTCRRGSANTIAIVPNASGGFQLINLPRCS